MSAVIIDFVAAHRARRPNDVDFDDRLADAEQDATEPERDKSQRQTPAQFRARMYALLDEIHPGYGFADKIRSGDKSQRNAAERLARMDALLEQMQFEPAPISEEEGEEGVWADDED